MLKIIPIPAFTDNYIWAIINPINRCCTVVDPGDAKPVIDFLQSEQLHLDAILITHHHHDHTGGVQQLRDTYSAMTYGPTLEAQHIDNKLSDGNVIDLAAMQLKLSIFDIPGHTKGHIAYYNSQWLFCGDTLFSAGCGRLFEGTAEQMYHSLAKMTTLPDDISIYCAHEYTAANLKFAQTVEPENSMIQLRIHDVTALRKHQQPTLPSTLGLEKSTNPFLRCHIPAVIQAVQQHTGEQLIDPVKIFQALRAWKDTF